MNIFKKKSKVEEPQRMTLEEFTTELKKFFKTEAYQNCQPYEVYGRYICRYLKLEEYKRHNFTVYYSFKEKIWTVNDYEGSTLASALFGFLGNEANTSIEELYKWRDDYYEVKHQLDFKNTEFVIRKVVHNKEKATTVVWFNDRTKVIVKRSKGAKDDVYTAVAFAVAKKMYKANSTFQTIVDKTLEK